MAVTDEGKPASPSRPDILVRGYASGDYPACRSLWVELTEQHRRIYGDGSIGGDDPGSGFDSYLAIPKRVASWVAESDTSIVGLTGLFDHGASGEVEPVVVTRGFRGRGVGRRLIERVVAESVTRGYEYLAVRPVARNLDAIQRFYDAGFRTLGGHVDLTMDLAERRHRWLDGAHLHGLDFQY
jgi:GNAT superfamily N-acetyltransferase